MILLASSYENHLSNVSARYLHINCISLPANMVNSMRTISIYD